MTSDKQASSLFLFVISFHVIMDSMVVGMTLHLLVLDGYDTLLLLIVQFDVSLDNLVFAYIYI